MKSRPNGVVLNGQNVRGKLRRSSQNVTCALEVPTPDQQIDIAPALSTVRKDARDFGTGRGISGAPAAIAASARPTTKRCMCKIINDLSPIREEN